jgi:trans-aconitate methyltransferase
MVRYLFLSLLLIRPLCAAEQAAALDWMADEYAQGNRWQLECFRKWLDESNTPIEYKDVISFGCGTGENEAFFATTGKAKKVHGIDASRSMIEYSKNHHHQPNLTFEHCTAENFQSPFSYDTALASCCFHWFSDKPKALQAIAASLKSQGRFFANIETQDNPEPFGITVYHEMLEEIPGLRPMLTFMINPTGSSRPTYGELHIMLQRAGFTNISINKSSYDWTMTKEEWRKAQLPLLLSTPGAQHLINTTSDNWPTKGIVETIFSWKKLSPEDQKEHDAPFFPLSTHPLVEKIRNNNFCRYLFNNFLKRCLTKSRKNDDGTYTWTYETMLVSAKKK